MPRQNRGLEGLIGRACKIRKRGCASSSSSSSILQNYRFKRAILVGKRGGSSTPVPTWKMSSRSPASMAGVPESPKYTPSQTGSKIKQAPVSARKLAATLWELNEIPSPRAKEDLQEKRIKKEMRRRDRIPRSVQSGSLPPHLSDPSHSPVSEDRSGTSSIRRRVSAISQRIRSHERNGGGLDSMSNASLMEIETRSRGPTPSGSVVGTKSRLRDVSNGLTTSKELLKILNRVWGLEEQHSSSMSLVSALRGELERARVQVDQLIREQKSDREEINYLMKRFAEEKATWKSKEQERIMATIQSIGGDLEVERKLRRRTENLNAKLSKEFAETKASLSKAMKELESERRARELVEQVCDELARGIGENKAEVEELKIEYAKVQEEVEKEREMLQLADVWREERVQMKLSEAKFQLEEKNAAVDKLRSELEAFLRSKRTKETRGQYKNRGGTVEVEEQRQLTGSSKTYLGIDRDGEGEGEVEDGEEGKEIEEEEDDSAESDLHSIELNMDNNSKSYNWSYAAGAAEDNPKRVSVEEEMKGRKSISEKYPRGSSISHNRSLSEGIDWDFNTENYQRRGDGSNRERLSESNGLPERQAQKGHYEDEVQRYNSVKDLRDRILSSSRMASAQGFASPTRQWTQRYPSQDPVDAVRERSKVAEMVKGMRESGFKARLVENKGESRNSRHKPLPRAPKQ
ncbi:golgin family A protein [Tasmannia lanceolata]|uniref:golgin family A protein n=1 Tax=Tasmannia lanceolata TaxID=3420 RepID=UPI004063EFEB